MNVRFFRADKDDLGGLAGRPGGAGVGPDSKCPRRLDLEVLKEGMANAFPTDSRVTLQEVMKLQVGKVVPGEELYVVRKG